MESLKIDTGVIRLLVNDDPSRVIQFNPEDVGFAERFYQLIGEFQAKQEEYERRQKNIAGATVLDRNGLPENLPDSLALLREACEFMTERIDWLFGKGTSAKAFEGQLSLLAIEQFFDGITPFIQPARAEKMARYTSKKLSGRVMK